VATYAPKDNDVSVIDYFLAHSNNSQQVTEVNVLHMPSSNSDHRPVQALINASLETQNMQRKIGQGKPLWKKTDASQFATSVTKFLNVKTHSLNNNLDIELVTEGVIHSLIAAEKESVPHSKPSKSNMRKASPEIVDILKKSKTCFGKWKQICKPANHPLHQETVALKREARSLQRQETAMQRTKLYSEIQKANIGDQQLFYYLIAKQRKQGNIQTNELEYQDTTYKGKVEVCSGFGQYFSDLATPRTNTHFDEEHKQLVESDMELLDEVLSQATMDIDPLTKIGRAHV
jgi:hypothetical protein